MYVKMTKTRDTTTPTRANSGADAGIDFISVVVFPSAKIEVDVTACVATSTQALVLVLYFFHVPPATFATYFITVPDGSVVFSVNPVTVLICDVSASLAAVVTPMPCFNIVDIPFPP